MSDDAAKSNITNDSQRKSIEEALNSTGKRKIYVPDSFDFLDHSVNNSVSLIEELSKLTIDVEGWLKGTKDLDTKSIPLSEDEIKMFRKKSNYKILQRNILGLKKVEDWINEINIGNIMHISPVYIDDLTPNDSIVNTFSMDSIFESIILFAVSYFSMSTENRFIHSKDSAYQSKFATERWHRIAVEIVSKFLPSECPLVAHIISSYQKHYCRTEIFKQIEIKPIEKSFEEDDQNLEKKASNHNPEDAIKSPVITNVTMTEIKNYNSQRTGNINTAKPQNRVAAIHLKNVEKGNLTERSFQKAKKIRSQLRQRNIDEGPSPVSVTIGIINPTKIQNKEKRIDINTRKSDIQPSSKQEKVIKTDFFSKKNDTPKGEAFQAFSLASRKLISPIKNKKDE